LFVTKIIILAFIPLILLQFYLNVKNSLIVITSRYKNSVLIVIAVAENAFPYFHGKILITGSHVLSEMALNKGSISCNVQGLTPQKKVQ